MNSTESNKYDTQLSDGISLGNEVNTLLPPGIQYSFAVLIHELRNPLTNIKLSGECINEMVDGTVYGDISVKKFTEIILRNANKLEHIVTTLLSLKDEEAKEPVMIDLSDVIDDALAKAEDRIFLKNVTVNKQLNGIALVNGNEEQLSLAFLNIIINAVEAIEDNKDGTLDIGVYNVAGEISVLFKDNGCGMEQQVAEQIFRPHYTHKPGGTGVGLTHTKKILEMHNAAVSVNSLPGNGTSVVINFKNKQASQI